MELGTCGGTGRGIALPIDTRAGAVFCVIHPGDDIAPIAQCCDGRLVLGIRGGGIDLEFCASSGTACVITLTDDTPNRAVLGTIHPGNDKAAIEQTRNRRALLDIRSGGIDPEFGPNHEPCIGNEIVAISKAQGFDARNQIRTVVAIGQVQVGYRPGTQSGLFNPVVGRQA